MPQTAIERDSAKSNAAIKRVKSFRLSVEVIDLIVKAAAKINASETEIVEACMLEKAIDASEEYRIETSIGDQAYREPKGVRSFRLRPEVIDLISSAAANINVSEGDLIEACTRLKLNAVVEKYKRPHFPVIKNYPSAVAALTLGITKRNRKIRKDKGSERTPKKIKK